MEGEQKMKKILMKCKKRWAMAVGQLGTNKGLSTIEIILILVVLIALIIIFKDQLINLVNTIFDKITSESSGI